MQKIKFCLGFHLHATTTAAEEEADLVQPGEV
jgi:hypothetical protein